VSLAVAVSFVLAVAVPEVRGPGACPASARVAEQLRAMLPDADGGAFPPGARLEVRELPASADVPVRLELKLEEATSGRELARRVLPGNGSCAERAQALAVVAANWAAAYRTTGPELPRPPAALLQTPPTPATGAAAAPPPASAPAPPVTVPSAERVPSVTARPAPHAATHEPDLGWSLGAGGGLVTSARGTSGPLVTGALDVWRADSAWVARLGVVAAGTRTLSLGGGEAAWRRATTALGVARRWGSPAAFASLGADALVGASFLEGRGFAVDENRTNADLGAQLSARAGARLAAVPLILWGEAGVVGWAREQRVRVGGAAWSDTLPRFDVALAAGIAWSPHRR
jgi:hypothetical protein